MDTSRRKPSEPRSNSRDADPASSSSPSAVTKLWHWVGEQWRIIDQEYKHSSSIPWDQCAQQLAWGIVLIGLCLALQRYHGSVSAGIKLLHWCYPDLGWSASQERWTGRMYWAGFKIICYVGLPALYIRFVLKERVWDHGFNFHVSRPTAKLYLVMFVAAVLMTYLASFSPEFAHRYPIFRAAHESPLYFWSWELAYGFQFVCLEFFFRGFILFVLARRFGALAIFVAILPYSMIHYTKPFLETIGSMAGGIILGTLALRTRSIYGGAIAHIAVGWSMDVFALWRKDQLWQVLGG